MRTASKELREEFHYGINGNDGINEAEKLIIDAGGRIERYTIDLPSSVTEEKVLHAVRFLIDEWEYGIKEKIS